MKPREGKGTGQGHTDIRLEVRVWLTPKPWLSPHSLVWTPGDTWLVRGVPRERSTGAKKKVQSGKALGSLGPQLNTNKAQSPEPFGSCYFCFVG